MNNLISVSLTKVATANIVLMGTAALTRIQKARDEDYERKIVSNMKCDRRGFFETLFRKPKKFVTREQADEFLRTRHFKDYYTPYSEYDWSQMKFGNQYDHVKRILVLAQNSCEDHMYVTADDMWYLADEKPLL